ncbi:MAG TPA: DUF938 domain-containing protein [Burkholderiales bacterium]
MRAPGSGVRDFEHIAAFAARCALALMEDNAMPANNRLFVFKKQNRKKKRTGWRRSTRPAPSAAPQPQDSMSAPPVA